MKKIIFIVSILFASFVYAQVIFHNYSPPLFSYHTSTNRIDIHFVVSNVNGFSLYIDDKTLYNPFVVDKWITNDGFTPYQTPLYSGGGPFNFYIAITNNANFSITPGKKVVVKIYTNNSAATNGLLYKSWWFVLEDTCEPEVYFNLFEDIVYSGVQDLIISTHDNSGREVVVFYTFDGTNPTTNSSHFTNSFQMTIGKDTVFKYFAKDMALNKTEVFTKTFRIRNYSVPAKANIVFQKNLLRSGSDLFVDFKTQGNYDVFIYNVTGNVVFKEKIENSNKWQWNKKDLLGNSVKNGVYFVEIVGENGDKIIKKIFIAN